MRTATESHLCIFRVYTRPRLGKVGTLIGHSTLGKEEVSNESVQKPVGWAWLSLRAHTRLWRGGSLREPLQRVCTLYQAEAREAEKEGVS